MMLHFFKRSGAFWLMALGALLISAPCWANSYRWTGENSRSWQDPLNWEPNGVPGTDDDDDEATISNGVTVSVDANVSIKNLTLGQGTRLVGIGKLTLLGIGNFTDSRLSVGEFFIGSGAVLNILSAGYSHGLLIPTPGQPDLRGNVNSRFDCAVSNSGIINWNAGNLLFYRTLRNVTGATFNIRSAAALTQDPQAPTTLINSGTVRKLVSGDSIFTLPVTNTGSVVARSGKISFYNSFLQTKGTTSLQGGSLFHPGRSMNFNGGRVSGNGTIQSQLVANNGAVFAPGNSPGSLVINGNYAQSANGILDVELGGTTPGTQYDQMIVTGSATLGGTLNILQFNGFVPAVGNSFELMEYLTVSGDFAKVNNLFPAVGRYFTTSKAPDVLVAQAASDSVLPTVAISSPLANKGYASLASITGTSSDATSGIASVTVKLYRYASGAIAAGYWNGTSWDAVYTAAKNDRPATGTTAWSFTTPALGANKYSVTATAKDKAGNAKVSSEIIFWIDLSTPTVAITSPANGAVVSSLSTVSGTASDGTGSGVVRVDLTIRRLSDNLYWNGTAWTAAVTNLTTVLSNGTWSRTTGMPTGALLTNGQYTLSANAVDNANLQRAAVSTVTVTLPSP
jgi:hypothetical protein